MTSTCISSIDNHHVYKDLVVCMCILEVITRVVTSSWLFCRPTLTQLCSVLMGHSQPVCPLWAKIPKCNQEPSTSSGSVYFIWFMLCVNLLKLSCRFYFWRLWFACDYFFRLISIIIIITLSIAAKTAWWRGTAVERQSCPANFLCCTVDLQLMGDHLCG